MYLIVVISALVIFITMIFQFWDKRRIKYSLENNNVLITGAGGGLGRELCLKYAADGANIICVDINPATNKETVETVKKCFPSCKICSYTCNLGNYEDVKFVLAQVLLDNDHVDILINNAGLIVTKPLEDANENEIQSLMDVNVMSQLWTIKALLPSMKNRRSGCIVGISSLAGVVGFPGIGHYASSKHAITGLMEALHHEVKNHNIRTLCVHPSLIKTPMVQENIYNSWLLMVLTPTEVAEAILKATQTDQSSLFCPFYAWHLYHLTRFIPFLLPIGLKLLLRFEQITSNTIKKIN